MPNRTTDDPLPAFEVVKAIVDKRREAGRRR